jgi:hypothetical protein
MSAERNKMALRVKMESSMGFLSLLLHAIAKRGNGNMMQAVSTFSNDICRKP